MAQARGMEEGVNPETKLFEAVTKETPREWAKFTINEQIRLRGWWWKVAECVGSRLILEVVESDGERELRERIPVLKSRHPAPGEGGKG
jgi:hypothetical protein